MIDHMAMVFAAEGLDASETVLMLAYCNHTDAHGYCWPGIARLADETGMSERTVKRTNTKLKTRKLIKSVRRTRRDGTPITNLTRVNLALLTSMRRLEQVYDDNLVEALTFDDEVADEGLEDASDLLKCQSGTHLGANLTPTRGQSGTQVGVNLAPKSSVETSEKPPPPSAQPSRASRMPRQEEEGMPSAEEDPVPGKAEVVLDAVLSRWEGHRPPTKGERRRLALKVAEALAEGFSSEGIVYALTHDLSSSQVRSAVAVVMTRTSEPGWASVPVPAPRRAPERPMSGCARHPYGGVDGNGQCLRCVANPSQEEAAARVAAEEASVRGEPCKVHGRAPRNPDTGECVRCATARGSAKHEARAKKAPIFTA